MEEMEKEEETDPGAYLPAEKRGEQSRAEQSRAEQRRTEELR